MRKSRVGKFKKPYILNFSALFSAEFTQSQDKRAGISKNSLSFSTLFLYIPWIGGPGLILTRNRTLCVLSYHPSLAHFTHLFRSRCALKPFAKKFSSSYLLHSFPRNFLAGVLKKSVSKSAIFWHSFWPLWILLIHSRLLFHSG